MKYCHIYKDIEILPSGLLSFCSEGSQTTVMVVIQLIVVRLCLPIKVADSGPLDRVSCVKAENTHGASIGCLNNFNKIIESRCFLECHVFIEEMFIKNSGTPEKNAKEDSLNYSKIEPRFKHI